MNNSNHKSETTIKVLEKIGKYKIEIVINKRLFELQVISEELYQTVTDKLLFKIQNLREELELIQM